MSTTSSAEKRREASPDDRFGLCMHDFLRGWRDDTDNRLAVGWEASAKFWDQSHSVLKKETNAVWPAIENYSIKEIMTGYGPHRQQGVVWSWSLQPMCFQDTTEYSVSDLSSKLNFKTRDETIYQNDSVCLIDRCHSTVITAGALVRFVFATKAGRQKLTMCQRKTCGISTTGVM